MYVLIHAFYCHVTSIKKIGWLKNHFLILFLFDIPSSQVITIAVVFGICLDEKENRCSIS